MISWMSWTFDETAVRSLIENVWLRLKQTIWTLTHRGELPVSPRPCSGPHIMTLASSMKSSSYMAPSLMALMATLCWSRHLPNLTTPNCPEPTSFMKVSSLGLISHFSAGRDVGLTESWRFYLLRHVIYFKINTFDCFQFTFISLPFRWFHNKIINFKL